MSSYIINIKNTSAEEGTVRADLGFSYSDNLNDINDAQLKISGTGETKRSLFEIGSEVKIYRNGTLGFYGIINGISYLNGGGISADVLGYEGWLGKENGEYSNSPYTATASATIANDIIGESSYFSTGTINTGSDIDFKLDASESLYNSLQSLIKRTGQDISISYSAKTVSILNHKGSSTSVATLNDGIQIQDLVVRKSYPLGNDVRVFGKGDGENQIKSDSASYGQNATSKATYGTIRKDYTDSSVVSVSEANTLADQLVAKWKDPIDVYEFDVLNPSMNAVSGDVITLNSQTKGLSDVTARVVGIKRGIESGNEFLILEVTNEAYSTKSKSVMQKIAELEHNKRVSDTYSQGTTDIFIFPEMINASSSAPLRVISYLSENDIIDEVGEIRLQTFTLDYDVDPYRSGIGTATEQDRAPDVGGSSSSTAPGVGGSSGSTEVDVDGTTADEDADVTGDSGEWDEPRQIDSDSNVSETVDSSWDTLCTVYPDSASLGHELMVRITVQEDSGGPEDIEIRVRNDGGWVFGIVQSDIDDGAGIFMKGICVGDCNSTSDDIDLDVRCLTGNVDVDAEIELYDLGHDHSDGSYNADDHDHGDGSLETDSHAHADGSYATDSHGHADGSYAAASHNHAVSVGDEVSDAESVNATGVNIYIDYWNGSSWVNKHSVLNTGNTLDYDVDISDGGTYPDAAGFWRARIYTNNANPDLVQATIKCKYGLDT